MMNSNRYILVYALVGVFGALQVPASAQAQEWVARYNGPGNGYEEARDVASDDSGNVYATGFSRGSGSSFDYATIKYDSGGKEQWVARYNGSGNGFDYASDLEVDASGNVYVTGRSAGSGSHFDYATIKYDSAGNEQWVARYNGPFNWVDSASALAVDILGNVYVTGYSYGSDGNADYATIKYDSAGNEQWVARWGQGNALGEDAAALAVDTSGNVYVTGTIATFTNNLDYLTIKYDSAGNEQWV
ncbi:MAG: SBBP repeat-containing protein, partial [Armatimonadetes bacterium]|nr:SBBP repeat-containing protein [Armatimonadota bacterium]